MRTCLFVALIAVAASACGGPEPAPCPGVVDDYAVWNALIGERANVVIVNETVAAKYMELGAFPAQGAVALETTMDLLDRNEVSVVIDESSFDVAGEVHVLPYADVPTFYDQRDRLWQDFTYRYGTGSSWSLSRPGFGCGEAVVYVWSECGFVCGAGTVYIFSVDENGDWIVVGDSRVWVS